MTSIPTEFVDWVGLRFASVGEGERVALDDMEMRFAIKYSEGLFHVLRWERSTGPFSVASFLRELDAVRQLMLTLGGDGRSINSLARISVPLELPASVASVSLVQTEAGSTELTWDEGGERHLGIFRKSRFGQTDARRFAQCIGATIPELADSLRSADGGPLFSTVESA